MIYYKNQDTGKPNCVSKSIDEFLIKANKKFPRLLSTFQEIRIPEKVGDETIIGVGIQTPRMGQSDMWTSVVLVYSKE